MLAESEPQGGADASSYELKAITDDLGQQGPAANRRDTWEDEQDEGAFNESGDVRVDPIRSPSSTVAGPWETPAPTIAVSEAVGVEPWYSRVLQAWGVVFLVWAAMIVARALFLEFFSGSEPMSRSEPVSSVVSVLLLVPGAAALFLLVDLGRYIRGLRPSSPTNASTTSPSASPFSLKLRPSRSWSRLFQAASSARS